ncbi:MAG: hypothetical protein Q7S79_03815 [bacterium]|nr:hypothetical protein [bacterium]
MPALGELSMLAFAFLAGVVSIILYKRSKIGRDDILKNLQTDSKRILESAVKKSQSILQKAEEEGLDIIDESKTAKRVFSKRYEAELSSVARDLENDLKIEIEKAEKEFLAYLDSLKARTEKVESNLESIIQSRIEATFTSFDAKVTELLSQTQTRSFASIEEELKNARRIIDEYKTQQMKLVDDNVISILEKTINIVLAKKLTLRDQLDLVQDALEKAKIETSVS